MNPSPRLTPGSGPRPTNGSRREYQPRRKLAVESAEAVISTGAPPNFAIDESLLQATPLYTEQLVPVGPHDSEVTLFSMEQFSPAEQAFVRPLSTYEFRSKEQRNILQRILLLPVTDASGAELPSSTGKRARPTSARIDATLSDFPTVYSQLSALLGARVCTLIVGATHTGKSVLLRQTASARHIPIVFVDYSLLLRDARAFGNIEGCLGEVARMAEALRDCIVCLDEVNTLVKTPGFCPLLYGFLGRLHAAAHPVPVVCTSSNPQAFDSAFTGHFPGLVQMRLSTAAEREYLIDREIVRLGERCRLSSHDAQGIVNATAHYTLHDFNRLLQQFRFVHMEKRVPFTIGHYSLCARTVGPTVTHEWVETLAQWLRRHYPDAAQ